jgi:hypothetical protein
LAVGRFAAATGFAGSVFTSEESDSNTLAHLPGRDARTNLLDLANYFVAGNTRIGYARELRVNGCCVRVAYSASLDADAHLSRPRRSDGPLYEVKSPGFRYFDRSIRLSHLRLLSMCRDCLVFVHRNFERGDCLDHPSLLSKWQAKGHSQMPETIGYLSGTNSEISEFSDE